MLVINCMTIACMVELAIYAVPDVTIVGLGGGGGGGGGGGRT